jgi:hypothetical protein
LPFQVGAMRILVLLFGILFGHVAKAQSFPQSFIGHWKGTLEWYQSGKQEPQKVTMQLIIRPADTAGQYTWQLIYGERGEDNRPYLLKPVDSAKGHWVVDERNGILLDAYLVGNKLHWRKDDGGVLQHQCQACSHQRKRYRRIAKSG